MYLELWQIINSGSIERRRSDYEANKNTSKTAGTADDVFCVWI